MVEVGGEGGGGIAVCGGGGGGGVMAGVMAGNSNVLVGLGVAAESCDRVLAGYVEPYPMTRGEK